MHKTHSNRDIYGGGGATYDSYRSTPRSGVTGPIVEFPPTLPRHYSQPPQPPPHRLPNMQMTKSRSMHDWEMQPLSGGLQREFQESLLMPMPGPGEKVDQREHRTEPLPGGGHESLAREVKADAGRRLGPDGREIDFK